MVSLSERGEDVAERRVPGHWEGDPIIGKNGTSCVATLVERMSGFTGLLALPSKHAETTADAVIEYFHELPEMMRASLAWDRTAKWLSTRRSPWPRRCRSTSPTLTPRGSDRPTRTPTGSTASTCPREPRSPITSPTSPRSRRRSTTVPAAGSAS